MFWFKPKKKFIAVFTEVDKNNILQYVSDFGKSESNIMWKCIEQIERQWNYFKSLGYTMSDYTNRSDGDCTPVWELVALKDTFKTFCADEMIERNTNEEYSYWDYKTFTIGFRNLHLETKYLTIKIIRVA